MGKKRLELEGKRFGRFIVLKSMGSDKFKKSIWKVKCDCGNLRIVEGSPLVSGKTKSCGCLSLENFIKRTTTHGKSCTRFYVTWQSILTRCNNPNIKNFKDYGGRGIKCLWTSFEEFKNDMYKSYLEHVKKFGEENTSIDRIDNNGNYCKENCRWATRKEQNRNSRHIKLITYKNETKCISEWAEEFSFDPDLLIARIYNGWSTEKALTTPVLKK